MTDLDRAYHRRRAEAEQVLASCSATPAARFAHCQMAEEHSRLAAMPMPAPASVPL